ncbi:family 43 glycosylhydrolase [Micromonospora echinofusca]|uniref:Family 43 glycosylhydrolase n=1 Tax=Micromonospora echinofusca TaxID=47858 RepID=A0ABS3VPJ8_MICEH|nr:family 43 glycosylhydrolase [Micromonospora echinofusca]MBO4206476.1 family 43 glycosylhydrolase [Micromonospora echinofusca]
MKRLLALVVCLALLVGSPAYAGSTVRNPLNGSADPTLTYVDGNYYLATTLGDRIGIWRSPTLAGLATAPETTVYRDPDPSRNRQVWAPGLYRFDGRWYIYYTASDGTDANHRMYVIESAGADPLGPYQFKARIADHGEYAIDGEPFVHNGRRYFAWSGPGRGMGGPAQIYLQAMDTPWSTTGARVALPASGGCTEVREGAVGLRGPGRLFLVYSSCDTGKPDYQLWMKSIADGLDPLVPANWVQHAGPVFWRNDAAGVYGPGHNGFFTSPDGTESWIVYHGKTTSAYTYDGRTTRAQRFTWNADGTPNFGRPLGLGDPPAAPSGDPWSSQDPGSARGYVAGDEKQYFDRTPDGNLGHWWQQPDGTLRYDTWGGPVAGRPTGFLAGAEQHAFARTPDGRLRHFWWAPGVGVRAEDWGAGLAGDPAGMVTPNGQKHVFGRASDGTLAHWWQETDGTVRRDNWGGSLVGTPTAYTFGAEQHVFARGTDNSLRHYYWFPGIAGNRPALDDWGAVGTVHSDPTGFASGQQQHVFYRTADGSVKHRLFDHGDWQIRTDNWGGNLAGAPYAFRHGQTQHVYGRGVDGALWHLWWQPGAPVRTQSLGGALTNDPVGIAFRDEQYLFSRSAGGSLQTHRGTTVTVWPAGQIAGDG